MPFVVGENVGPYRIIEKLGHGGMATVFKAYHAALDRYVAIKALHPAFMEDPSFLARFQREARVVAKLEHPNIVPVYDFAEHEGRPYLVMKFIQGETLKARLVRNGVLLDQVVQIVEAVGTGLTYAHGQGILHRDVKPSNVLLADDGRIYLADFGLARIAQVGESTISGDMMLGTPQYISPEQAMGVRELDAGTDIYSFGVMLYELIVGQVPFSADTPFSIIHDHIYTPLPLPRAVNSNVSEPIERVLLKALAKERADRFEDISSLVDAFSGAFAETDLAAGVGVGHQPTGAETSPPMVVDETVSPQQADAPTASILEAAETPIMPQEAVAADESEVSGKKIPFLKRLRWWQIALGAVVLVFCCLLALSVINERQKQQTITTPTQTALALEELPAKTPIETDDDDQIGRAKQLVEENPDDPFVQLSLVEALLAAGQYDQVQAAMQRAIEISGDSPAVYLRAGNILAKYGINLYAVNMYLTAASLPGDPTYEDVAGNIAEAVYLSSVGSDAIDHLSALEADLGPMMMEIARIRHTLHNEDRDVAKFRLQQLREQYPDSPEVLLLEAEIISIFGDDEAAIAQWANLLEDESTPFWVRRQARIMINKFDQ